MPQSGETWGMATRPLPARAPGDSAPLRIWQAWAAVAFLWLVLVTPGLFYGLPQLLDPDEMIFVGGAFRMLAPPYGDPEWYGAPASTLMDVLAVLYGLFFAIGKLLGAMPPPLESLAQSPQPYVLAGRVLSALATLAAGSVLLLTCNRMLGLFPALTATVAFLLAPGIVQYAQVVRMDAFLILFVVLTLHFAVRIVTEPTNRNFVLAGLALGAAVVSKYPGVIVAVTIPAAALLAWREGRVSLQAAFDRSLRAATASLVAAFVLAPYLFLNFGAVLRDILFEARSQHLSATSLGFLDNLLFYAGLKPGVGGIPEIMGAPTVIAGLGGYLLLLSRHPRSPLVLYPLFGAAFIVFIAMLPLQWTRWALPVAPVIALGVGVLAVEIADRLRKPRTVTGIVTLLAVLLTVGTPTMRLALLRAFDRDTRVIAAAWAEANLPPATRVAIETYAPQLSALRYDVLVPAGGALRPMREVWPERPLPRPYFGSFGRQIEPGDLVAADFVITSDWEERYRAEQGLYPNEYALYRWLRENFVEIEAFQADALTLGPTITVFKKTSKVSGPVQRDAAGPHADRSAITGLSDR